MRFLACRSGCLNRASRMHSVHSRTKKKKGALDMSVIFTAKRDEAQYLSAFVLVANSNTPIEFQDGGFEDLQDLKERVRRRYGEDAVFLSPKKFQLEVAQR